jgi:hypothetical protein
MSTTNSATFSEKVRRETKYTRIDGGSIDSDSSGGEVGRRRGARAARRRKYTRTWCGSGRRDDRKRNRTSRCSSRRRNASLVVRCRGVRGSALHGSGGNDRPRPRGKRVVGYGSGRNDRQRPRGKRVVGYGSGRNDRQRPRGKEAASDGDGDGGARLVGVGDGVGHLVARDRVCGV